MMSAQSDFGGRSFLVVDDVRFARVSLVRMLKQMGEPEVYEAEDGAAALYWLGDAANRAHCLISDIRMPNMTGLELLKAFRVGTGRIPRGLPIVFLTGQSELVNVGPALLLRLDEFVAKPVSQQALRSCLERIFDPHLALERES